MKAAILRKTGSVVVEFVDKPVPKDDEVLVRVSYTGICGSDVPRVLEGRVHDFPIVLGHEFSGTVESVGCNCDSNLVGKRVAGIPLVPCRKCESCLSGNYSLCDRYGFIGSRQMGSMAEYVCVQASNVFVVDEEVSDLEAAFFEPMTVALHAMSLAGFESGSSVAVFGAGTIGVLLAQALVAEGAELVVLCNRSEERLRRIGQIRGVSSLSTSCSGWREKACDLSGDGFDFVFDTVACSATVADAGFLAKKKCTVCFIGTPKEGVSLGVNDWERLNRKELTCIGSWMSYSNPWPGSEWKKAAELLGCGKVKIDNGLIDRIYGLNDTQVAFDRFRSGSAVTGKILIDSRRV